MGYHLPSPPARIGLRYLHSPARIGLGYPPPPTAMNQDGCRARAVRLLRSRRRTFLFDDVFTLLGRFGMMISITCIQTRQSAINITMQYRPHLFGGGEGLVPDQSFPLVLPVWPFLEVGMGPLSTYLTWDPSVDRRTERVKILPSLVICTWSVIIFAVIFWNICFKMYTCNTYSNI